MNNDKGIPAGAGEEDGPVQRVQKILQVPTRDSITMIQIGNVLNALGMTSSMLNNLMDNATEFDASKTQRPDLDGGVKTALEASIIKICDRLDSIMDDANRWTVRDQDTLEHAQRELVKTHLANEQERLKLAQTANSPHFERKPTVAVIKGNAKDLYVAFEGDINHLENCFLGVGETPQQAIEAFDHFFRTGTHTEMTLEFIQSYLAELDRKASATPFKSTPHAPLSDNDDTTPLQ